MSTSPYALDWGDIAFSKTAQKALNGLRATFIAAPREISQTRFTQLIKAYLPAGPVIVGFAKEPYILGFEGQPQFKAAQLTDFTEIIDKVNARSPHKIYVLNYYQREAKYIFGTLKFRSVTLVRGSWKYSFHTQEPYYALQKRGTPHGFVSPFASEAEARDYERQLTDIIDSTALRPLLSTGQKTFNEQELLAIAAAAAKKSYDYSFQTGVALGKRRGEGYELLTYTFNKVVPFQTYAMHYGASREANFSPPHDLNHYDTVHAEVELIIKAQKESIGLKGTTLFINLMPCPTCARMFTETDIAEFIYTEDHSNGYAIKMLEAANKKVRRLV